MKIFNVRHPCLLKSIAVHVHFQMLQMLQLTKDVEELLSAYTDTEGLKADKLGEGASKL